MRKIPALLICISFALMAIVLPVQAAENVPDKPSSLILHYYDDDEQPITGAVFDLHLLARADGNGGYTVTDEFDDYRVDLTDIDWDEAGRLTDLAGTLSAYAVRDDIKPMKTAVSNEKGDLTFSGLSAGLYLVRGEPLTIENEDGSAIIYRAQSILLPLPYLSIGGIDRYNVDIDVKYEYEEIPPELPEPVDITAEKVWADEEEEHDPIIVQLLCDGDPYDEQELSAENGWKYDWNGLEAGHDWLAVEKKVPDGYTVSVNHDGNVFTITNTSDKPNVEPGDPPVTEPEDPPVTEPPATTPEEPPTETTPENPPVTTPQDPPGSTPSGPSTEPPTTRPPGNPPYGEDSPIAPGAPIENNGDSIDDEPVTPSEIPSDDPSVYPSEDPSDIPDDNASPYPAVPGNEHNPNDEFAHPSVGEGLPQTGQLWWPVPILWALGIIILAAGIMIRVNAQESHE